MMADSELERVLRASAKLPPAHLTPLPDLRAGLERFAVSFPPPSHINIRDDILGGRPCEIVTANADGPAILYLHGGGYATGSPASHRHVAARLAEAVAGAVFTLDYRLAPEASWPAAFDDALAAYATLADRRPNDRLAVAGDSAGGGLAFAMLAAARARGTPMPACVVGFSPWASLMNDGASFDDPETNDPFLSRTVADFYADFYAAPADRTHPSISPVFADLGGLPPTLIQVGQREVFRSEIETLGARLRDAGVATTLETWPGMVHVWHLYWPILEPGRLALDQAGAFIAARTGHGPT